MKQSIKITDSESNKLQLAEETIARGLKSFVEVGRALKEIRDKRLYRQHYATFEEYCAKRWDISRCRAYEMRAASDVVEHLSATKGTQVLPSNEAQARPLTRLKTTEHINKAWQMAVDRAAAEGRPVAARDAKEAVRMMRRPCEVKVTVPSASTPSRMSDEAIEELMKRVPEEERVCAWYFTRWWDDNIASQDMMRNDQNWYIQQGHAYRGFCAAWEIRDNLDKWKAANPEEWKTRKLLG